MGMLRLSRRMKTRSKREMSESGMARLRRMGYFGF